jgi:hypothetical protein
MSNKGLITIHDTGGRLNDKGYGAQRNRPTACWGRYGNCRCERVCPEMGDRYALTVLRSNADFGLQI